MVATGPVLRRGDDLARKRTSRRFTLLSAVFLAATVAGVVVLVARSEQGVPPSLGRPSAGPPRFLAESDAWPSVVAIVRTWAAETSPYDAYLCAGTIVSLGVVVTAAHCLMHYGAEDLSIVAGTSNLCDSSATLLTVTDVIVSDRYSDTDPTSEDLAVVRFDAGTLATESMAVDSSAHWVEAGSEAIVVGWGAVEPGTRSSCKLVESRPQLHSRTECVRTLESRAEIHLVAWQLCAGGPNGDSCGGDSGGPLVVRSADSPSLRLIAVVSWGGRCLATSWGGVYTDLSGLGRLVSDLGGTIAAESP